MSSDHFIRVFHFLHGNMASRLYSWPFSMDKWTETVFFTLDKGEEPLLGSGVLAYLFVFLTSGQQG